MAETPTIAKPPTLPKTTTKEVKFPYRPFPLTQAIHCHPARFRVLSCGRRFGKTTFGLAELYQVLRDAKAAGELDPRVLVVAPTFGKVAEDWRMAELLFRDALPETDETDLTRQGPDGQMDFRSADAQGGAARGAGYNGALLDEAAYIPDAVWESDIRPSLADRRGRALFLSTPNGANWFYRLWLMSKEHPDYASWQYSTWQGWESRLANQLELLESMRHEWLQIEQTTSQRKFQQEYLAQFLGGEGQLWNVEKAVRGALRPARDGYSYVAGLDVARKEDWMATIILERRTNQVVALHRSRHRSWSVQKQEALLLLRQYPRVRVLIDSTGVGDPIAEDLRRDGINVEDVVFTMRRKDDMVENLSVALDHGYLGVPDQPETQWLLGELRMYQEVKTPSGNFHYGAPPGMHDDGVTALMLACWGIRHALKPAIDSQVLAAGPDQYSNEDILDFTHKAELWRRLFPNRPVPHHPGTMNWLWDSNRLQRYAERIHVLF